MDYKELKEQIRKGYYKTHTNGQIQDLAQFNIVILPADFADDFHNFCKINPVSCPLILASSPGEYMLNRLGDVNIKTDIPAYWIYKNGCKVEEHHDISALWQNDFVTFAIGCSFTFEQSLRDAHIPLLHVEQGKNIAMYNTHIPLNSAGCFSGNMVVSMRWIHEKHLDDVITITAQYPDFHGAPIHIGHPEQIGILDIQKPNYGDFTPPYSQDMLPVFWGCGVSTQQALKNENIPIAITHKPGCMLIGDISHKDILEKNY